MKGEIKCLFSSSVHPSWLGLEALPYPSRALREDADVWEPQPLTHSSLHTRIQTKPQALAQSPGFSCTELPDRVYCAYKSYEVSFPAFSPPLGHPGLQ